MSLPLALAAAALASAGFADLDAIDARVAQFTQAGTSTPGGAAQPVDRRLRLRRCEGQLLLGWMGQRRDTVVVQCPDVGGWRLFVPIAAASAQPNQPPAINRGDALSITVAGEGFAVSQPGEALESGAAGAWIRVRATGRAQSGASADAMRAQVMRPGLVRLELP